MLRIVTDDDMHASLKSSSPLRRSSVAAERGGTSTDSPAPQAAVERAAAVLLFPFCPHAIANSKTRSEQGGCS
jgi:hypothetical protein